MYFCKEWKCMNYCLKMNLLHRLSGYETGIAAWLTSLGPSLRFNLYLFVFRLVAFEENP